MAIYKTKRQIIKYLKYWDYLITVAHDKPAEFIDHGPNEFLPQHMVVVGSGNLRTASLEEVKEMAQWILLGYRDRIKGTSIILDFNIMEDSSFEVKQYETTTGDYCEITPRGYNFKTKRPATRAEKKKAYDIFINRAKGVSK